MQSMVVLRQGGRQQRRLIKLMTVAYELDRTGREKLAVYSVQIIEDGLQGD